jgi:outer membrane lipoprotein SlyB
MNKTYVCRQLFTVFVFSVALSACTASQNPFVASSRPSLYPNEHLQKVGMQRANADIDECMALADQYAEQPSQWQEALKSSAKGAVAGTAVGAVGGSVFSKAGRGAGAGAAVGGMLGLLSELNNMGNRTPSYERFTEYCLQKKGYEITGWR